jgi:hypothetical protein
MDKKEYLRDLLHRCLHLLEKAKPRVMDRGIQDEMSDLSKEILSLISPKKEEKKK